MRTGSLYRRALPVLTIRTGRPDKVLERDLVVQAVCARLNWGLKTELQVQAPQAFGGQHIYSFK